MARQGSAWPPRTEYRYRQPNIEGNLRSFRSGLANQIAGSCIDKLKQAVLVFRSVQQYQPIHASVGEAFGRQKGPDAAHAVKFAGVADNLR